MKRVIVKLKTPSRLTSSQVYHAELVFPCRFGSSPIEIIHVIQMRHSITKYKLERSNWNNENLTYSSFQVGEEIKGEC